MKTIQLLALAIFIGFVSAPDFAAGQDSWDDEVVRTYDVNNFTRIYLEGGYKVILEQSDKPGLRIKADEEAFDYIDVDSDNSSLRLKITKTHFDFKRLTLYINFVDLEELHIEGGIKLETKGYVDLKDFHLQVEGGALVEMELKAEAIDIVGEGGVSFNLKGVTKELAAYISGAGYLNSEELRATHVRFEIEGVGTGTVYATETLKASIEGVGKIRYKGNPVVEKRVEGIGVITND